MADSFDPYRHWLGVVSHERPVDHYTLLGLSRFEADRGMIEAAARQRIALVACHQGGPYDVQAKRLATELAAARDCLLDPRAKTAYDDQLHRHVGGAPGHVPMRPPSRLTAPPVAPAESYVAGHGDAPSMQMAGAAADRPAKEDPSDDAAAEDASQGRRSLVVVAAVVLLVLLMFGGLTAVLMVVMNRDDTHPTADGDALPAADGGGDVATSDESPPPAGDGDDIPGQVELIRPTAGNVLEFTAAAAELHGPELRRDTLASQQVVTNWTSTDNWLTWRFEVDKPGLYQVQVTYAATSGKGEFQLTAEGVKNPLHVTLRSKGTGGQMITDEAKQIAFEKSGAKTLTMRAISIPGEELMTLQSIRMSYDPRFSGGG
ncbi:MAG: hypothetical protein RIC55_24250 [Pirellulaceae bacterium]